MKMVYSRVVGIPTVKWVKFSELSSIDQKRARVRYENSCPWLEMSDWLYPTGRYNRLTRIERGLNIPYEEAELKRLAWREKCSTSETSG